MGQSPNPLRFHIYVALLHVSRARNGPVEMELKLPTWGTVKNWGKTSRLMVAIVVVLVACSSVVTLIANGREVYAKGRSLLFPDSEAYATLAKLAPSTTIEYFTSLLGAPQFRSTNGKMREYIYVHAKYYVQAIADMEGTVQAFTVTSRSRKFNPVFDLEVLTGSNLDFAVELHKTKFADLDAVPAHVYSGFGARRVWYHESYYFGNPGNYLTYIVAHADAGGFMPDGASPVNDLNVAIHTKKDWLGLDPAVEAFRQRCPINTFGIASMGYDIDAEWQSIHIGADYDTVRLLDRKGK